MKILIASDAWLPQVNGVVRSLQSTIAELERLGHRVHVIHPGQFRNFPLPFYPEIRLAFPGPGAVARAVRECGADAVHVATEGPVGFAVRRHCLRHRLAFSTAYHTKFPEYLQAYLKVPPFLTYAVVRRFHGPAACVMVATASLEEDLKRWGFKNRLGHWSRGVDLELFYPRPRTFPTEDRPILMYVGRVSREKNVEAFLELKNPGTKYVVGDGPSRAALQKKYPQAVFLGALFGDKLAEAYANADVVIFPSRTDTFGLVIVEALACGVPVAAYSVPGPKDIIQGPETGALHEDLGVAVERALGSANPAACIALAHRFTWEGATREFLQNLVPVR